MTIERAKTNSALLWALMVPAVAYLAWQLHWPSYAGSDRVGGMAGIVLGLFICSRPAAHGIDLIFIERGTFRRVLSNAEGLAWFLLNLLVLLVGWFVISVGASRLTTAPH